MVQAEVEEVVDMETAHQGRVLEVLALLKMYGYLVLQMQVLEEVQGDTAGAGTHYEAALKLKPDYPEALSNRGNTLHALGRRLEAIESLDRAVTLRPDYVEALSNAANILLDGVLIASARKMFSDV